MNGPRCSIIYTETGRCTVAGKLFVHSGLAYVVNEEKIFVKLGASNPLATLSDTEMGPPLAVTNEGGCKRSSIREFLCPKT